MTPYEAAAQIRTGIGGDATGLTITGDDPVLPSIYRVGTAAAASVGAATLGMSRLWQERGGPPPGATVHTRHAAVAFRSERYLRVNGAEPAMWADLSGDYPAAGGGWVRLHANYPNHRDAIVRALDVAADRAAVAAAVAGRSAVDVEDAVVAAGGAAAALRTCQEWANHPQAAAVAGLPLIAFTRLDDSPPLPLSPADSPLATVRVLDLTRVIAGPVAGRTLAAYGAQVLRVGADHLPLVAPWSRWPAGSPPRVPGRPARRRRTRCRPRRSTTPPAGSPHWPLPKGCAAATSKAARGTPSSRWPVPRDG